MPRQKKEPLPLYRTTISMPESMHETAQQLQREFHYPTFSAYVQELIRRDILRPEKEVG